MKVVKLDGNEPVAQDPSGNGELRVHSRWQEPDDGREQAFDVALALHAGHELDVLTFATCVKLSDSAGD
jgi:citrate synthase